MGSEMCIRDRLIALILIFKDKITGIVDDAMKNIDDDSGEILE